LSETDTGTEDSDASDMGKVKRVVKDTPDKTPTKKGDKKDSSFDDSSSSEDDVEDKPSPAHMGRKKRGKDDSSSDDPDSEVSDSGPDKKHKKRTVFKSPRKWLLPEKFDGTTSLNIFLGQFESCTKYNRWSKDDKITHLRISRKGYAAYILDDGAFTHASYEKLVTRLKSRFGEEGQSSLYRSQMSTWRRKPDETLQMLYHDVSRMSGLAYPGKGSRHRDLAATETFIEALENGNLRMRIRDKEPRSLDHALQIAWLAEANPSLDGTMMH